MSASPIDTLEIRARAQRDGLHKTAEELREKLEATREHLKPSHMVREHLVPISVVGSILALALGYGFAGMFTRH